MVEIELERMLQKAKADPALKAALLKTREQEEPMEAFCALCRQNGCAVTAGELFTVGQTAGDAKLRSVNGGGVNAIDGWDDAYEQFFATLIWT